MIEKYVKKIPDIDENETISKALGIMQKNDVEQLAVYGNGFKGLICLSDIVSKKINPSKTYVKTLVRKTPYIDKKEETSTIIKKFLDSGLKVVTIFDENEFLGIVSSKDLLNFVDIDFDLSELATECITLDEDEKIAKAKELFRNKRISRIPIIDKDEKMIGIVRNKDLVKVLRDDYKEEMIGDPVSHENIKVASIMSPSFMKKEGEEKEDMLGIIKDYGEVIIIRNNKPEQIITAKDILEKYLSELHKEEILTQVTGLSEEDEITKKEVQNELDKILGKLRERMKIRYLFLHVEKFHTEGGRIEYSIRARMQTNIGLFVARSSEWDLLTPLQDVLDKLERSAMKKMDKIQEKNI